MFYHIIWYPSTPLCLYSCRLFSFHYYITSFVFYQKTECKSIYYHFSGDHENSTFRKLARNKCICRNTCDFFRDTTDIFNHKCIITYSSTDNFFSHIPVSIGLIFCWGNWKLDLYYLPQFVIAVLFCDNGCPNL